MPDDVALLFARDPLQHTDEDIDAIIAKMRENRHAFNTGGAVAAAPAKSEKGKIVAKLDLGIDLGGL